LPKGTTARFRDLESSLPWGVMQSHCQWQCKGGQWQCKGGQWQCKGGQWQCKGGQWQCKGGQWQCKAGTAGTVTAGRKSFQQFLIWHLTTTGPGKNFLRLVR